MLDNEVMENLLTHKCMKNFSIEVQAEIIQMFEDIIRKAKGANIYATISELLDE